MELFASTLREFKALTTARALTCLITRHLEVARLSRAPFAHLVRGTLAAAAGAAISCSCAQAQTAQFSGVLTAIGSGFSVPYSAAVDARGDVFVADVGSGLVKEIVAVNGTVSSSSTVIPVGSGFLTPVGVAVDGVGDVFVADAGNGNTVIGAVYKIVAVNGAVSSSSTVIQIASSFSFTNPDGVAVDGTGDVFVIDLSSNVYEILAVNGAVSSSSTVITINNSSFATPNGVAVDGVGDVFVSDGENSAVYEIVAVNGSVSTSSIVNMIGSGFSNPVGVAVDGAGDVFVADTARNGGGVYGIAAVNGAVSSSSTVNAVGGGFAGPAGVAVDGRGSLYIADSGHGVMDELQLNGVNFGSLPVATSTPATLSLYFTFDAPENINAPAVLTQGAARLDFRDAGTGTCTTNGPSHSYDTNATCTVNVTFKPTRPGLRRGAVNLYDTSGNLIATAYVYGTGTGPQVAFQPGTQSTLATGFSNPAALAVDGSGNVFVADNGNIPATLYEIVAVNGVVPPNSTPNTVTNSFSNPFALAVDGGGNVFVADRGAGFVYEMVAVNGGASFSARAQVGSGFSSPSGVAVDGSGNVFVTDPVLGNVYEIVAVNGVLSSTSTVNTVGSGFSQPYGVAVDANGNVFVTEPFHDGNVKEIVATGGAVSSSSVVNTVSSNFFYNPYGVAVDASGNVFVADSGYFVYEIVAVNGVVSSGSTVIAASSSIIGPQCVAVDGSGNVFAPDSSSDSVAEIDFSIPPALSFASTVVGGTSSDSPKTVTIANNGNAALTFPAPTTGLNPSISAGFTLEGSSTCPQSTPSNPATLAESASCIDRISFTPTAAGSITGSLLLTDTHLNAAGPAYATQTITLSGTATIGPAAKLETSAVSSTVASGGNLGTLTVSIEDVGGDVVTTSSAPVTTTITGPNGYSQTVTGTAVAGVATLNLSSLSLTTPGIYTVTTTSPNLTTATSSVTVTAGAAAKLATSAVPSTVASGGNLGALTASIEDANGNIVTSSSAPVTVTITGPNGYSQTVTATAVNGVANLNLSSLSLTTAGTYTLTITGAGATLTSTFTVAAAAPQDFDIATATVSASSSAPVIPGAAVDFTLTLSPTASNFSNPITLTATGLPPGATYSFSPSTITPGSASASSVLTVQTSSTGGSSAMIRVLDGSGLALALLTIPFGISRKRRGMLRRNQFFSVVVGLILLGGMAALTGCGSTNGFLGQPARSYTITVTGTSGSLSHSTTVVLNLQ